jgi:glycosyltransferase involved in cell wall biosynthesis
MRLLILTGIFPPDIGGPATYVPRIATALTERGHAATVVTLSHAVEAGAACGPYPFRLLRIARRTVKPWRWLVTIFTLVRLGRKADVLFVNGLALEATLANLLLHKPLVMKVVGDFAWERATNRGWTSDDFESFQTQPQTQPQSFRSRCLRGLRAWWTARADRVIVPSRYLKRFVIGWGVPEERVAVIHNAVEPPNDTRPIHPPLAARYTLVTVGRLVPWKRVDQIIGAVAQLKDVGLVVIGDGPERSSLEEFTKQRGLADRVYFAGQGTRADTWSLMASCDLFVLNSTYEGFPHVVLEAMSLGLPVVATAAGGTPEIIKDGENGRLIDPVRDNQQELTAAVRRLLGEPEERAKLSSGALRTAERYSMKRMLDATESELLSLVRGD